MSDVPNSPARFFEQYLPSEFGGLEREMAGRSSPGALVFEVVGTGAWSIRLRDGRVEVEHGFASDGLVRIGVSEGDFVPVIVAGAERLGAAAGVDQKLVALRLLTADDDRARLLRESQGTLAFRLTAATVERRLTLALGAGPMKYDAPDCEVACALEDLWAIQSGTKNAFELLMDGKIRITGNAQLAMALGAAFAQ